MLDNERAVKISGAMFTMQRGAGATLSRALCQYGLDLNADVHRGGSAAVARDDRDADRHRSAPEVRRRRLLDRARRPVVHPDRRGAAHVDLRQRDARRHATPDPGDGAQLVVSAARPARPGATPAACCAPTSSTRSRSCRSPLPSRHPTLLVDMDGACRAGDRRARPALPDHRDLHRRHGPEPPSQFRHRGVRAGCRHLARGVVDQLVQRLPGTARPTSGSAVTTPTASRSRAPSSCTR